MPSRRRALACILALCGTFLPGLLPGAAAAAEDPSDWRLDFQFEGDGKPRRAELRLHEDRVRLREPDTQQEVLLSPEDIVILDHGARTYSRFTYTQLEATLGAVYASAREAKRVRLQELTAVLDSLSAEERALVEKEIARLTAETGPDPDRLTLAAGGKSEMIAGLKAEQVNVISGEKPLAETWITRSIPVLPFKRLLSRLAPLVPPEEASLAELLALLQRLEGFPLKVIPAEATAESFLVLKAERSTFSDRDFEVPESYQRSAITGR